MSRAGRTDETRAAGELEKGEGARQLRFAVDALGEGLSRLSAGDLVFRLDMPFEAQIDKLRIDFNETAQTLQDTMVRVDGTAAAIRSGTDEISVAADDLSRRTEQQAASLEETAAALDEITATVRKTAEGAMHARESVGTAKTDAERSGQIVRQAVEAMHAIEQSSHQIGQIIGVIDEIAFQTNLLALNAGVEAARAGDAGRGFAVVASEVRALAQRSADAAREIKTLISASAHQVEGGVDLVGQTGAALGRIVAQITEINGVVAEIAASAKEQATGLAEVNTAVNQMDQVTQQNAAMVEQTTAASHTLARETEALTALIGRFDVGRAGAIRQREPKAGRAAAPAALAAAKSSARRNPAPALRTIGSGGAMRKPEPNGETWDEF